MTDSWRRGKPAHGSSFALRFWSFCRIGGRGETPGEAERSRDEESGAGRLGDYVLVDFADGAAVGGDVRGGECVGVVGGAARPNQILANDQAVVQDWTIGPNRRPTAAQNPCFNVAANACVSGGIHGGDDGAENGDGAGDCLAQASLSKSWRLVGRMRFRARWDCNHPYRRIRLEGPELRGGTR